jgi:hypothetical protein
MTKTFSKLAKAGLAAFAFAALSPAGALAQTVDGDTSDGAYNLLASWTQADTGFADHGITDLYYSTDGTNLYLAVTGEIENGGNHLYIFFGHDSATGVTAGTQLPTGTDGFSPFNATQPTLDFEGDFGVRLTSSGSDAFVSIIDYRSGGNTDTFLEQLLNDGTPSTETDGNAYDGAVMAYDHSGTLSGNSGTQGFEISIPLAALGATSTSVFEAMAAYGASPFFSANTIPEIAGQSGTNLGNNPDFSAIGGNQFASFTLPVELSAFSLE